MSDETIKKIEKSLQEVIDYKEGEKEGFIVTTLLPAFENGDRPETGPMQFGDDWPGLFMRGDNACMMGMSLQGAIKSYHETGEINPIVIMQLIGLSETLQSCNLNQLHKGDKKT